MSTLSRSTMTWPMPYVTTASHQPGADSYPSAVEYGKNNRSLGCTPRSEATCLWYAVGMLRPFHPRTNTPSTSVTRVVKSYSVRLTHVIEIINEPGRGPGMRLSSPRAICRETGRVERDRSTFLSAALAPNSKVVSDSISIHHCPFDSIW